MIPAWLYTCVVDPSVVAKLLEPPDRRSIGRSNEVVEDVLADSS